MLRQVCLRALLAQATAWVPASAGFKSSTSHLAVVQHALSLIGHLWGCRKEHHAEAGVPKSTAGSGQSMGASICRIQKHHITSSCKPKCFVIDRASLGLQERAPC